MHLNTKPTDRKVMVRAISERLRTPAVYLRTPSYAYRIGAVTVNRHGTIDCEDAQTCSAIIPLLIERGWLEQTAVDSEATAECEAAEAETGEAEMTETDLPEDDPDPDTIRVHIDFEGGSIASLGNLIRMLYSKQKLINRMLKTDSLFIDDEVIELLRESKFACVSDLEAMLYDEAGHGFVRGFEISGGKLTAFVPYSSEASERGMDCAEPLGAVVHLAQTFARVKTELLELGENEKYHANAWLNRLGFGGEQHKDLRRRLMSHLNGFAAFRNEEKMQEHKQRLAEQRRIAREVNA